MYTRYTAIVKPFEICTNVSHENRRKNKCGVTKNNNNAK